MDTKAQRSTRSAFHRLVRGITLVDLDNPQTEKTLLSAFRRVKEADADAEALRNSQQNMFPDHDFRAWMEDALQPSLPMLKGTDL